MSADATADRTVSNRPEEASLTELILDAARECQKRLAALPNDAGQFAIERVEYHRMVRVQEPARRHEGRANVVATNGAQTILRETKEIPDAIPPIRENWATVKGWPKVRELLHRLQSLESKEHRLAFERAAVTPVPVCENYCIVILGQVVACLALSGNANSMAQTAAQRLLISLSVDGERLEYIAPLIGFEADPAKPIAITPTLRLRPVSEEEEDELSRAKSILGHHERGLSAAFRFKSIKWVIECESTEPTPGHFSAALAFNSVIRVLQALRIFQDGRVDFAILGQRTLPYGTIGSGTPNPASSLHAWSPFDTKYTLLQSERESLVSFTRAFLSHPPGVGSAWIELAGGRLDDAHRRELDRDRLIDSVVLLEAVLLHDGEDELGFRLASRGAALLGDSPDKRAELHSTFRGAYNRRSKILHGKADPGTPTGSDVMPLARAVLRTCIAQTEKLRLDTLLRALDSFAISRRDGETLSMFLDRTKPEAKTRDS